VGRVQRLLTTALKAWGTASSEERSLKTFAKGKPDARFDFHPPVDGLALRTTMRDLPREGLKQSNLAIVNFDHVWLSNEEMNSIIPSDPAVGDSFKLNDKLTKKFARYYFLDSVRGESEPYRNQHIEFADISFSIVKATDQIIKMKISGRCKVNRPATGKKNPYSGQVISKNMGSNLLVYGIAEVDRSLARFKRFEMLAVGTRWGGSTYNFRGDDLASSPIGFGFQLIADVSTDPTPPRFQSYNH